MMKYVDYMMKYVNYAVQGMSLAEEDWSEEDASLFRYIIGHELSKHRARDMNFTILNDRVMDVS